MIIPKPIKPLEQPEKAFLPAPTNDRDCRGIVILEYLIIGTIICIGAIAGLAVYRSALTEEYDDLGEAIQTQNQGYAIPGVSWGSGVSAGYVNGSHYHEQPEITSSLTWFGGTGPDGFEFVPIEVEFTIDFTQGSQSFPIGDNTNYIFTFTDPLTGLTAPSTSIDWTFTQTHHGVRRGVAGPPAVPGNPMTLTGNNQLQFNNGGSRFVNVTVTNDAGLSFTLDSFDLTLLTDDTTSGVSSLGVTSDVPSSNLTPGPTTGQLTPDIDYTTTGPQSPNMANDVSVTFSPLPQLRPASQIPSPLNANEVAQGSTTIRIDNVRVTTTIGYRTDSDGIGDPHLYFSP